MNIIAQIYSGVVKAWDTAVADIEADYAKVKAALPASAAPGLAAVVSDIKQGASDAIGLGAAAATDAAPLITAGVEKLADSALATASNGLALPLVPLVNDGIDNIVALATNALNAWALKTKAGLVPNSQPAGLVPAAAAPLTPAEH